MTKSYRILVPIILLAFWLRVWQLPQTPPGLWYDEAYYAMDAAWLLDGGPWRIFFVGNNGREPIFIYLEALFISIFGTTALTARLVAPLAGTLTVPLMYVLARRLLREPSGGNGSKLQRLVAYLATAGLATSFWHLGLSRGGYRGILLPLATTLVFYLFWRAWQTGSARTMLLAGLALGASQYTYLAARALPLVFGAFALTWTLLQWLTRRLTMNNEQLAIKNEKLAIKNERLPDPPPFHPSTLWLTLILMAAISALVFAPLGWIFYQNPELFSARTGDVLFWPGTLAELLAHLGQAVRLFIDSGDPNWRHHLPGRPMLGWLGWLGFWPGLVVCLRRWRRGPYLFLLVALLILFLPALLSEPPTHALRLSPLLPIYYLIFAAGLVTLAQWLVAAISHPACHVPPSTQSVTLIVVMVLLIETSLTTYDYFGRWAPAEETYVEYNTPLVDFVEHLADLTWQTPVILPFQIYVHPTARYLLHDDFSEQPPPESLAGPVLLATVPDNFRMLNVANIPELPAYAWLARGPDGQGVVYISRPPRRDEQDYLRAQIQAIEPEIYRDRFGGDLAQFRRLADPGPLLPMFTSPAPQRNIDLNWANQVALNGYDVIPELVRPNRPITLNLYWHSLTDLTFDQRLFLQLIDSAGNPINQWEGEAVREDMYRWRPDGILPSQHTLWIGPDTPPGPYLVRLGFFDRHSGERLPLFPNPATNHQPVNQMELGLFYVLPEGDETDPRLPARPLQANFAGVIELIGVTLSSLNPPTAHHNNEQLAMNNEQSSNPPILQPSTLSLSLHWRALRPTDRPYTVFLQLLNANNEVVAGFDRQPFNGLYPTTRWSPGELIADGFNVPLPEDGLPTGPYRLITGFYEVESGQRLPLVEGGDFVVVGKWEFE